MGQDKTLEEMTSEDLQEKFFSQLRILADAPRDRRLTETDRIVDILEAADSPRRLPNIDPGTIRFLCRKCGAVYEVAGSMSGLKGECAKCHAKLIIPRA